MPKNELDLKLFEHRFAASLKTRREKAKLSLAEVAEAVGVSLRTAYSWEEGTRSPPLKMLPDIATALGCSIHALVPKE